MQDSFNLDDFWVVGYTNTLRRLERIIAELEKSNPDNTYYFRYQILGRTKKGEKE
jgi:hypothetical protein